jgi:hypothetical protein
MQRRRRKRRHNWQNCHFVSCKISNRDSKMPSAINVYWISSINNEKHLQFQIVPKCDIYFITNLNIQMIILF